MCLLHHEQLQSADLQLEPCTPCWAWLCRDARWAVRRLYNIYFIKGSVKRVPGHADWEEVNGVGGVFLLASPSL